MVSQLTLNEVLGKAIQKEIGARLLYIDPSQRMKAQVSQNAFQELARQEEGHQQLLERYLRGELTEGALGREQALDYNIAEHLDQPEISPDMKLKDVFLLAANREKASHEFYLGLAGVHPIGQVRKLLEELATQELEHKQRVEFLYTEVAFPQTDGG